MSAELQVPLLQASKTIQAGARIDCMILEGPFLIAGLSLPASSTSSKAQVPASIRVWDIQTGQDSSLGALQVSCWATASWAACLLPQRHPAAASPHRVSSCAGTSHAALHPHHLQHGGASMLLCQEPGAPAPCYHDQGSRQVLRLWPPCRAPSWPWQQPVTSSLRGARTAPSRSGP